MNGQASTLQLCAAAIGLLAGLLCSASWQPVRRHEAAPVMLPAASQLFVAAETRPATEILTPSTTEEESPQVDGWLQRLPPGGLNAALSKVLNHPSPLLRQHWLALLFSRWAKTAKQEALTQALALESPSLRLTALDAVLSVWAATDAEGAWAWLLRLDDPMLQSQAIEHLLDATAARSPVLCAEWALALADPFLQRKAVAHVAAAWSQANVRQCQAWAQSLSDAGMRRAAMGTVISQMAGSIQSERALETAMQERDPAVRRELLSLALEAVAFAKPKSALAWLRSHRARLDDSMQPTLRAFGAALANDRTHPTQIATLARELPSVTLRDAFIAGAALRLIALGHLDEAARLPTITSESIEREDVQHALLGQ